MANTYLTISDITREILFVLHEKLTFISTINRQYDNQFANTGAKIGSQLRIRLPNKYTTRTGKTMNAQNSTEQSTTLTLATQRGVDMDGFSSADLALSIDDFSKRYIEPAMAVLASVIESDTLQSVTKDIYNLVGTPGTTPNSMLTFGLARAKLNQYLAPKVKSERCVQIESIAMATMVNAFSSLFHDQRNISEQYAEGYISDNSGLMWYENERIYTHTNGDDVVGAVDEPSATNLVEGSTTLHMDALGTSVTVGSVFTIAGVKAVHPETKDAYEHEQQFVVTNTPTIGSNEGDVEFQPPLYTSSTAALQTINHMPSNNDVVTFVGAASTAYEQHLAYHKDAFAFVTADLPVPEGTHFAGREVYDGISMRIVQDYDIHNDEIGCRIDVLYGFKTLRREQATRITG